MVPAPVAPAPGAAREPSAHAAPGAAPPQPLQRGHSVWLAPERFEAPDFSPDQCVAELRRYVPLPTVKAELQTHLVVLKNKLVEALNEDYGDYVGLSSQLAGLEGAVVRMRQPLLDTQAKLSAVQDGLKAELAALQQGLQARQDAAAARATLELMQEVAASTGKVEKLLAELAATGGAGGGGASSSSAPAPRGPSAAAPAAGAGGSEAGADGGGGDGSSDELDARCRMLLRVAGEAARLVFLAERGKHLAFVKSLERRVDGARFGLNRQLQAALGDALRAGAWGPAGHCLRAFLELGEAGQAEEGLAHHLVGPLVRQVVTDVRQQQLQAAAAPAAAAATSNGSGGAAAAGGGSGSPLSQVASLTLSRLRERCGPLLAQLTGAGGGLGGIDLLGAVLLGELSTAVADGLPGLFSPGNPASFHANYAASQALLAQLEGCAASRAAVERLRASAAAGAWAKRWNLPVFFSLVYQDIAGTFEAAATASQLQPAAEARLTAPLPPLPPRPDGDAQQQQQAELRLAVSACLWGCLQRALSPSVFLLQLADKFGRLVTQLLVRYNTWLADVAVQHQAAAAGAAAAGGGGGAPGQAVAAGVDGGAAADGGAGGEAPRSGPAAWAPGLSAEAAATICADADTVKALVQGPLLEQLQALLAGIPPQVVQQLGAMLSQLADSIGQHGQEVLLLLARDVLEHCVACVRQLKGITATYRMTAKGPPVRHSHYVAGVLQPLRTLLERPPVSELPGRLRLLLAARVVDDVNGRYTALAEELLVTVRKTESSLKRLKKARPGEVAAPAAGGGPDGGAAAAAAAAMSDSEKIGLQLYLDVQEHGRQVARLGLAPEELASFRQLLATVTPADKAPQPQLQQLAGEQQQQQHHLPQQPQALA